MARSSPGPLSSGEGIIYAVRDPTEEWKTNQKTDDGRMVLTDPGISDKRLFILDEEFASALSCTKREGNTLSAILRNLWDSGTIEPLTKTSRTKATGAHIGICTHITVAELARKLDETEALNGFANRFLWICARRQKLVPLPKRMDPSKLFDLQERLIAAVSCTKSIRGMRFSAQAEDLWCQSYPVLSKSQPGLVGTVMNRAEAQTIRLSMLYALLDQSSVIQPVHLQSALALWDYCKASSKYIFAERFDNPAARRIHAALKTGSKSTTELHKVFHGRINRALLKSSLQELISQGAIKLRKVRTHGPTKNVYELV